MKFTGFSRNDMSSGFLTNAIPPLYFCSLLFDFFLLYLNNLS